MTEGPGRRLIREESKAHLPRSELLKEDYSPTRIHLIPLRETIGDQSPSRQPGFCVVIQTPQEFFTRQRGRFRESRLRRRQRVSIYVKGCDRRVEYASHIQSLRVERFVPGWVQPTHSGGKVCSAAVLGGDILGVLGNTVIHSVDRFNEFLCSPPSVKILDSGRKKGRPCIA